MLTLQNKVTLWRNPFGMLKVVISLLMFVLMLLIGLLKWMPSEFVVSKNASQ